MTLSEYCTGIADAIRVKEGSTEKIPAPDHAARILAIQTGVELPELSNPAGAAQIIAGYEAIDGTGVKMTGTAKAAEAPSIEVSETGLITAVSAGLSATKQLTTQGAKTVTPGTADQIVVAAGVYTTGDIAVKGDSNLAAENIKRGVNIFGVVGSLESGASLATGTYSLLDSGETTFKMAHKLGVVPSGFCLSLTKARASSVSSDYQVFVLYACPALNLYIEGYFNTDDDSIEISAIDSSTFSRLYSVSFGTSSISVTSLEDTCLFGGDYTWAVF